jgi:uncharacterized protein (TIGR00375 family)
MSAPAFGRVVDLGPDPGELVFADLHVHSRYSRATSPAMEPETMAAWARRKGVGLLGTGDFTHPEHFRDLKDKLEPDPSGFYRLRREDQGVRFVPTAEVANMYSQGGRGRRVHLLIVARDLESAGEINRALASRGNVASDGRPIFGFSARHLVALVRAADPEALVIPAHIWTPWFSVLGERSGFDSLAECFEEELPHIAAVETGLSSDPEMNWRLSQLDPFTIISNSDAHSPAKLAREANAFRGPLTRDGLRAVLTGRDREGFRFTVEFFPEEGKYHWPGHRECGVSASPAQYLAWRGTCPVCSRALTAGVASRVEALADRPEGAVRSGAVPSVHLVPLEELVAEALGQRPGTKAVAALWDRLIEQGGSELNVLLRLDAGALREVGGERVAEAVLRMRRGEVEIAPGHDGVYGAVRIFGARVGEPSPGSRDQLPLLPVGSGAGSPAPKPARTAPKVERPARGKAKPWSLRQL